jgi:hypothetical protein
MNEFIYSYTQITDTDESKQDMGIELEIRRVKVKFSLLELNHFYESDDGENNGVMLHFRNGTNMFIIDNFDRIDKLHNEYLKEYDKQTLLTAAQ